jgi:hypothetical protein
MMHSASRRGVRDPTCAVSASSRGSRKAKAKATVYKGRPASIEAKRVRDLRSRRGSEHRRLRGPSRSAVLPSIGSWTPPSSALLAFTAAACGSAAPSQNIPQAVGGETSSSCPRFDRHCLEGAYERAVGAGSVSTPSPPKRPRVVPEITQFSGHRGTGDF